MKKKHYKILKWSMLILSLVLISTFYSIDMYMANYHGFVNYSGTLGKIVGVIPVIPFVIIWIIKTLKKDKVEQL